MKQVAVFNFLQVHVLEAALKQCDAILKQSVQAIQ